MAVHVNDQIKFIVQIVENGTGVDITSTDPHQIIFKKPDGSTLTTSGTIDATSGVSGVMHYTAGSGVIDAAGQWKIQGYVNFGSSTFYSDISSFRVYKNI